MLAVQTAFVGLFLTTVGLVGGTAAASKQSEPPPAAHARDGELSTLVLITSDTDWLEKWNTPASSIPQFSTAKELKTGEAATVLVLLSGLTPANGRLKALCAIEIRQPDGVIQAVPETACYDEMSLGQRKNMLMADARVEFKVEQGDPDGLWLFRIIVKDAFSSSRTASEVSVRVIAEGARP
jgi:hypothetical protein